MCPLENLLSSISGKRINGFAIQIKNVLKGRFAEETNFELFLKKSRKEASVEPVIKGKYFSGRGRFYKPWLEIYYQDHIKFISSPDFDLSKIGLDEKIFGYLLDLLPPGSRIMVIYLNHEETKKGLELDIPAPVTPIGYLLWKSGCTWFKDWYFSEGFWEGDIKLQGNKPLDKKDRRKNLLDIYKVLDEFVKKEVAEEKIYVAARKRARDILETISKEH